MLQNCVDLASSETGLRVLWGAAGGVAGSVLGVLSLLLLRAACKGAWHAGAWARRRMATPPVVLADEVLLLADALRDSGDRREGDCVVVGPTVVTPGGRVWLAKAVGGGGKIDGRDVTHCYSREELKAIVAAAADRLAHFAALDREGAAQERERLRHEAIGMPAPANSDTFPVLGGNGNPARKRA